jgi:malate dehydrogenase (oxaloacetate-decarboxylating)(NADP+)
VMLWESPAVAKAAMESGVARVQVDLEDYRKQLAFRQGMGEQIRFFFTNKARNLPVKKRIVFAEGEETKIIRAAAQMVEEGIGIPVLVGRPEVIGEQIKNLGVECCFEIVNPAEFDRIDAYAQTFYEMRQRKGLTLQDAYKHVREPNVFGPMMVRMGDGDAFISGLTSDYPEVIRPALQIHHTAPGARRAAGVYIMIAGGKVYLFTDATVNIDPTPEDLAEIACLSANFARELGIEPRVALLSFSNFGSTPHPLSTKVQKALKIIRERCPDFPVDGEMQADTAVGTEIVEERCAILSISPQWRLSRRRSGNKDKGCSPRSHSEH